MVSQLNKDKEAAPLYAQIAEELSNKIHMGQWTPGDRIPSEMNLCDQYDVSRITIRKAIDELVGEGLLYRERAKGTFVLNWEEGIEKKSEHFTRVRSFTKEMEELGKQATTLSANVSIVLATKKIAKLLHIDVDDKVLQLKRVRGTKGDGFVYFVTNIPYNKNYSLNKTDYYGSFYEYLANFNIKVNEGHEYIEAVLPDDEIQKILKVNKYEPILKRVRMNCQKDKNFYEYTICYYIGSRYRYYIDMNS